MLKVVIMAGTILAGFGIVVGDATAGDAAKGERVFKRCAVCHAVDADGDQDKGPTLHGVFGRAAGAAPGYEDYSEAMKTSGVVWTAETMDEFLAKPKQFIPGNTMSFSSLRKQKQRDDVIAYLEEATK